MSRLTCVVEGHGEVNALPNLCARIITYLDVRGWHVDSAPIRLPRSILVDEGASGPTRKSNKAGICRALGLAAARGADGVLIVCDSDDDCAATWGPHATAEILLNNVVGVAVMSVREYEAWLLWSFSVSERTSARILRSPETIRDAKGAVSRLFHGYLPAVHQLQLTRRINIGQVRKDSDSFDKLVRGIAQLCNVVPPPR